MLIVVAALTCLLGTPAAGRAAQEPAASAAQREVSRVVTEFLARLGNHEADAVTGYLAPTALIAVTRQADGHFEHTIRTGAQWLAELRRRTGAAPFQEPLANVQVTVESGHLAHLRADFTIVRAGQVVSSGVDHFVLIRQPAGWKIVMIAYTSRPARR